MSIENMYLCSSVESDGITAMHIRDPPGQRSVYIPPGDTFRETYRLATFKDYPTNAIIDPRQMATNGFYFTGYRDRVKCFSCGQSTEQWKLEDDPGSSKWHTADCDFFHGRDTTNLPIHAMFSRFGFARPGTSISKQPRTGAEGIEMGESSSTSSQTNGSDTVPHNTYQPRRPRPNQQRPASPLRSTSSVRNGFESTQMNSSFNESLETFPCFHPVNPHMRSTEARLQTFIDNSSIWPAHRIRATPREIVDAGMYYLGERDRVKCWYCNGGLQNWEYNDSPWTEHAKWFPLCEYVLRQKGVQFVHSIVSQFPNLRRPTLTNPSNSVHFNSLSSVRSASSPPRDQPAATPIIVDPRQEQELRNRRIEWEMSSSEFVLQAKMMGFQENALRKALKKQYEQYEVGFSTFESLVDAVLDSEPSETKAGNNSTSLQTEANPNQSEMTMAASSRSRAAIAGGEEELQELQDLRACKICKREQANVVLIPCGHLAICVNCSENTTRCPTCHSYIREKVRSYLS